MKELAGMIETTNTSSRLLSLLRRRDYSHALAYRVSNWMKLM